MIPHVWGLTFGLNLSGAWGEWCVHTKTRGCMQCDETETAIYRIGLMWIRSRDDADWLHNLQCSLELEIIKKN